MKKIIALLMFLTLSALCFAQANTKPPAPKENKPTYQVDPSKKLNLNLFFSLQQINDFSVIASNGLPAVEGSDLTGKQIQSMKANYKAVVDSIQMRLQNYLKVDQAKFTADTTKKYHSN